MTTPAPDRAAAWEHLRARGRRRRLAAGADLPLRAGHSALFVESGLIKVLGMAGNGQTVLVAVHGPGGVVPGWRGDTGHPLVAVVAVVAAVLLTIPGRDLDDLAEARPDVARILADVAFDQVRELHRQRIELIAYSAPKRVIRALAVLSGLSGNGAKRGPTIIPVRQTDLADLAGASREVTVRVLRDLRKDGVVDTRRARIEVIDFAELVQRG